MGQGGSRDSQPKPGKQGQGVASAGRVSTSGVQGDRGGGNVFQEAGVGDASESSWRCRRGGDRGDSAHPGDI